MTDLAELNLQWLHDFRQEQKQYREFYPEDVTHVPVICMYVGADRHVQHVSHDYYALVTPGRIERGALMSILEEKAICPVTHKRHEVGHVLSYAPQLAAEDIRTFILTDEMDTSEWLRDHKDLGEIYFPPCISILQELNALILIYKRGGSAVPLHKAKKTRRLRLATGSSTRRVQFRLDNI